MKQHISVFLIYYAQKIYYKQFVAISQGLYD